MRNPIKTTPQKNASGRIMSHRASLFGFDAAGDTKQEAEQNLLRDLKLLSHDQSPKIYCHNGHTLVFSVYSGGCQYTITSPDNSGPKASCSICGNDNIGKSLSDAVRHLLDYDRKPGNYDIPDWAWMLDEKQVVSDWRRHDAFQLAYKEAERLGERDPHRWACDNCERFLADIPEMAA